MTAHHFSLQTFVLGHVLKLKTLAQIVRTLSACIVTYQLRETSPGPGSAITTEILPVWSERLTVMQWHENCSAS